MKALKTAGCWAEHSAWMLAVCLDGQWAVVRADSSAEHWARHLVVLRAAPTAYEWAEHWTGQMACNWAVCSAETRAESSVEMTATLLGQVLAPWTVPELGP